MKVLKVVLRAQLGYDTDVVSAESALSCPEEESVVQQQFAEECDINTIVRRFGVTGVLPVRQDMPLSGDFTHITDFQSAVQAVRNAEDVFDSLPAEVRARFYNDPAKLISFLEDEGNREEAVRIGLLPAKQEEPKPVEGVGSGA